MLPGKGVTMKKSLKYIIGLIVVLVIAMTLPHPAAQVKAAPAGPGSVLTWNSIMLRAVVTNGVQPPQPPPASFVYGAYAQAAVYNAVVAIEGGYQPYKSNLAASPGASVDAAVATAAHDVLVHYFPLQQSALDVDYQNSLAAIADSPAKAAGIQVGSQAAAELIALRQGDGLNANIGFTMPAPGPGVWQLPAGASPVTPWMSKLKPFMLASSDQFRPGPPPDLTSSKWAKEYNEVKMYGRKDSTVRTPEQTAIALFWSAPPLLQFNLAYQQVVNTKELSAVEAARLMAMGNLVAADSLVACFDAKYHYLFWRPVFAIAQGDTDGNQKTISDTTYAPLLATPGHPEYPSAHGCVTSAQAEVFAEFLDTQNIGVDIPSGLSGVPARHFATANDLKQEIINARVWAGIHYRGSDEAGANVGRKVAHWTLTRYFLPGN
jgi:hypothetical protein